MALSRWCWQNKTEGFIIAAQEQALTTNVIKNNIHHLSVSPLCHLCHSCDETEDHLISGCSFLVQPYYNASHNQVGSFVHKQLCKSVGFNVVGKWWNYVPERELSNPICKILRDLSVLQTDTYIIYSFIFCTTEEENTINKILLYINRLAGSSLHNSCYHITRF